VYEQWVASAVELNPAGGGPPVWHKRLDKNGTRRIRSWSLRHDFYNDWGFYVPREIPPGRYRLTLKLTDLHHPHRTASKSLPFTLTTLP
jgi:hypothetical protein